MAAPPRSRVSPPAIPDELVEEILLRLPPDEPACLLRASLVCKTWGGVASHPAFRRRLHEFHRTPPVLGVLHNWYDEEIPRFIPTTASSFSLAAPDRRSWQALDCRHGRGIFLSKGRSAKELLVWEPITGVQQPVPVPAAAAKSDYPTAAVFCASDGCDHRGCLGGPFRVVFIFSVEEDDDEDVYMWPTIVTSACVYSSEAGTWGQLTSMRQEESMVSSDYSSVLIGISLLYFMSDNRSIHEYDLARHNLAVFDLPDYMGRFNLMLAEDGGLGVIQDFNSHLRLWSREASDSTDSRWVLSRVLCLENLLPNATTLVNVLGFAEGANAVFVSTVDGLFTIELQSERARKVLDEDDDDSSSLIPIVSFYTPHPRLEVLGGKHHDPPLPPNPAEEMGSEEGGGEEEKTLEQVQELFDKGCKAMKLRQCK